MVGGQESARSTLHLAELFRLADAAGLLRDPELRRRAHAHGAGGARRRRRDARLSQRHAPALRSTRATVKPWSLRAAGRRLRPRRHLRDRALARHRRRRSALDSARQAHARARHDVTGLCRGGMFPGGRRRRPARARSTTTSARSTKRPRIGAQCLVLVAGGLPKGSQRHRRRARAGARRHRRAPAPCAAGKDAARDRAAASDVRRRPRLREHARAGATISATNWATGVGVAIDVYHVWWDPDAGASDRARGRDAFSPITSATGWCRPPTSCSTAA